VSVKRQLVNEEWNEFARRVLPPDCSSIQKRESRRAFYAGAWAVMIKISESISHESEPTDEDLSLMDDVHAEMEKFALDVLEGRA